MVKAIPTIHDGIQFRSKLEASWYEFFKLLGANPVYEPGAVSVCLGGYDERKDEEILEPYLPDFYIQEADIYVEVKPLKGEYGRHDALSIMKAYVLGYEHPTAIVLGSPINYVAVLVQKRYKGNPRGSHVQFTCNSPVMNSFHMLVIKDWGVLCYPDENGDYEDPRNNCFAGEVFSVDGGMLGRQAWNNVQWMKPR